jgi:hypothetical protein
VLVPEVNLGQLSRLLRAEFLVDAVSFTQVQGIPFRAAAMEVAILQQIGGGDGHVSTEGATTAMTNGDSPNGAAATNGDHPTGAVPTTGKASDR